MSPAEFQSGIGIHAYVLRSFLRPLLRWAEFHLPDAGSLILLPARSKTEFLRELRRSSVDSRLDDCSVWFLQRSRGYY